MQNDWVKWLLITKFASNNIVFSSTDINFFYVNKDFNSRMFFNLDSTKYVIIRERLEIVKTENISNIMQRVLKYMQQNLHKVCEAMIK